MNTCILTACITLCVKNVEKVVLFGLRRAKIIKRHQLFGKLMGVIS